MTIEGRWEEKELGELDPGDIFYFDKTIQIKTDTHPSYDEKMCYCVDLETGDLDAFGNEVHVGVIEDATLKIGGYYK